MRNLIALVLTSVAIGASAAQTPSPARTANGQPGVLFLVSDDFTTPYAQLVGDAFRDVMLAAPERPALYFEAVDASRFGDELEPTRRWLDEKYHGRRVDLVVAIGEAAVGFLAAKGGAPWPEARVLYLEGGGDISEDIRRAVPQAVGVILDDHLPSDLDVIKQILPGTRRVALVMGAATLDERRWGRYAAVIQAAGLEPIVIGGMALDQMTASVSHLPPDAVALILAPMIDAAGVVFGPRPCEIFSGAASVPSFTPGAQDLGCGVVGGLMRDWTPAGHVLGTRALAFLRGADRREVGALVPVADYTTLAFDYRQLRRWAIPESRLPPGSVVSFRPHTLWNDYWRQVLAATAIVTLIGLMLGGIVIERHRRRGAELAAQRHLLVAAHLDRRAAMGELATSLAHELNQPLNAILQNAGVAQMLLTGDSKAEGSVDLKEIIADIRKDDLRASEIITRMRTLLKSREFESTPLDPNALVRETVALVRADAASRDIRVDVQLADGIGPISGDRVHLQQVLLNLLLNAVDAVKTMPAERRSVLVRTAQSNGEARVAVEDRGTGIHVGSPSQIFEPFFTTKGEGMGMGLAIARSIVDAHSGRMAAENNAGGGATVWFSIPATKIGIS